MCFEHFRREREEALNRQGGMEKWATQRWRGWWHVRMLEDVLAWAQQGDNGVTVPRSPLLRARLLSPK